MCGIYGITDNDPKFIEDYIETCKHRGPDGYNIYISDSVTLGHNLLSIMADPDMSQQPWKTPKGNRLVYNGEIFNYNHLIKKYKNFKDTTGCDTELLAWGLETYGISFIDEIDSMHGFAYYDEGANTITLSRDHAGIKPLYYAKIQQGLVFGSEVKGMLDKVPNSRTIDNLAASFQSRTGLNPLRNTLFSGIKKLLPGETIVWDIENKKISATKRIYIKPNSNIAFNETEFREQLVKAVERCSIGRRKIGVFLSGGLDSSVVAYELGKIKEDVNTFTNKFSPDVQGGEDFNSDAKAARILADKEKFIHTEVEITPQIIKESWDDSVYFGEQPVYTANSSMYCYTNKFLSEKDIVVTMSGDMGDEILAGYVKYRHIFQGKVELNNWNDVLRHWLDRIKRPVALTDNILSDDILLNEFGKCFSEELWNAKDPTASYMALDCVTQVPAEFFIRNDTYGMAYSMEGRFPLASKFFMQYCLDIPTKYKIGSTDTDTKMLTKIAYEKILPKEIIKKEKTGWTVPIGHWLKKDSDKELTDFYLQSIGEENKMDTITVNAKVGKSIIPAWAYKSWKEKYQIK
jgi:asparagine synthase (glutamine-hydrolysing)